MAPGGNGLLGQQSAHERLNLPHRQETLKFKSANDLDQFVNLRDATSRARLSVPLCMHALGLLAECEATSLLRRGGSWDLPRNETLPTAVGVVCGDIAGIKALLLAVGGYLGVELTNTQGALDKALGNLTRSTVLERRAWSYMSFMSYMDTSLAANHPRWI